MNNYAFISFVLLISILLSSTAFADESSADKRRVLLYAGFEHWYSDIFKTDRGIEFSVGIDYRLPLRWTQFSLRYERALINADPVQRDYTEFNEKKINFVTIGPSFFKDFNVGSQTVTLSVLPLGALWVKIDGHRETVGTTSGYGAAWLFDGRTGMFIDTRYLRYYLRRSDGSKTDIQSDASVVVGVVTGF